VELADWMLVGVKYGGDCVPDGIEGVMCLLGDGSLYVDVSTIFIDEYKD
jgi:hypothetical protein